MAEEFDYDLFTIGAGSGGVRASRWAATQYGAKVAVAELPFDFVSTDETKGGAGGTCVIRGCVPKKLLIYGGHYSEEFHDSRGYGWQIEKTPEVDWQHLIRVKNEEIERLNGVYKKILGNANVEMIEGRAKVTGPNSVEINGQAKTAKNILIATGGRPSVLDIPGKDLPGVITSDHALVLPKLPEKMLIYGAGYIAVEFAGIFHAMGVEVHLAFRGEKVLRGFDEDIRDFLTESLTKKGLHLHPGYKITEIVQQGDLLKANFDNGKAIVVGNVMMATGRHPNTKNLGLESAGVELVKGAVKVDEYSQTNIPSIWAIGDVTNRVQLTPVALMEGMKMAAKCFGPANLAEDMKKPDYEDIATAVFSQPPIGTVGLTEQQAMEKGLHVDVYVSNFRHMKAILADSTERTLMKLLVNKDNDKVIGCHMCGPDGPEIIQGLAVAMKAGATKKHFDSTVGIHPTAAEEFVTMRTPTRTIKPGA